MLKIGIQPCTIREYQASQIGGPKVSGSILENLGCQRPVTHGQRHVFADAEGRDCVLFLKCSTIDPVRARGSIERLLQPQEPKRKGLVA